MWHSKEPRASIQRRRSIGIPVSLALMVAMGAFGCGKAQRARVVDSSDSAPVPTSTTGSIPADAAALAAGSAAMGTTVAPVDSPAWPAEWAARKFFDTAAAYIYARDKSAAKEAEAVAIAAGVEFQHVTGAAPGKGLVIVTDAKDPLLLTDADVLANLISRRQRAYQATTQPIFKMEYGSDGAKTPTSQKSGLDTSVKLAPEAFLRCIPYGLLREDLIGTLAFPTAAAGHIRWVAAIPTRAACKRSAHDVTQAAMKSKEVTLGQRLLMLPWLPTVESILTDELLAERPVVLFNEDVMSRSDWDGPRRQTYMEEFRNGKNAERNQRIKAHEKDLKAKGLQTGKPDGK